MQDSIHPKRPTGSPRARVLAAAALMSGVVLAGCGGSSGSPTEAALAGTTTSGTTVSAGARAGTPGSTAPVADALVFASCMRSNGVPNFPDPSAGGGFRFPAGSGIDPSSSPFKAAQAKCHKLLPGGGPPAPGTKTHPSAQALARMLKVAQCMRRHGISDFPDPQTSVPSHIPAPSSGPFVVTYIDGVILVMGAIDTQSPAFTHAAITCKFPVHN